GGSGGGGLGQARLPPASAGPHPPSAGVPPTRRRAAARAAARASWAHSGGDRPRAAPHRHPDRRVLRPPAPANRLPPPHSGRYIGPGPPRRPPYRPPPPGKPPP